VLLRACPSTSSHTRPQLRDYDRMFCGVAVERADGSGWCHICRNDQEKGAYSSNFPPTVGDVDVRGFSNQEFMCPVWRDGDCAAGAGEGDVGRGGGGLQLRVRACVTLLPLQLKCTALWTLQPPCNP
jgi:hypothetical protein